MAKGLDKSIERRSIVSNFGKNLAKRAKSKCELCEASGTKLYTYEVPPISDEPDFDKCIMICSDCLDKLERLSNIGKIENFSENDLRFLGNSIWSETPIIKALSAFFLEKIRIHYSWADEVLENAYLDEETLEIVEKINFSKK